MSINRINTQPYINAYTSNASKPVENVNKSKDVDRVEISSFAKTLQSYSTNNTEVVENSEKVAEIKNQIQNGTYNIDAQLTARSILQAMKESN